MVPDYNLTTLSFKIKCFTLNFFIVASMVLHLRHKISTQRDKAMMYGKGVFAENLHKQAHIREYHGECQACGTMKTMQTWTSKFLKF